MNEDLKLIKEENKLIKKLFNLNRGEDTLKPFKEYFTNFIQNSKNGP